ncbi:MAG: hypothetical protein IJU37_12250 [Desulfovibrio sp.]|nr:hypothetical protein [Desulfovibrio sp.]
MPQLSQVLSRLPHNIDVHMSTMGHVVWVCWNDNVASAVGQILMTYGGMLVVEDDEQALWFFFTDDVFLALARLIVWGNFHDLPVSVELFPGRLQFGRKGNPNLHLDGQIQAQKVIVPDKLEVWVHPKSRDGKKGLPGITFEPRPGRQGMAAVVWATMSADVRMPYTSTQSWFALVHPLGSPLDKNYQAGWDSMFKRLDEILRRHKVKSLFDETFLMLSLENLMMLRSFMRDYLDIFSGEESNHWPCVCVVADRKNLNFNIDLPRKIGLKWDSLAPDYPYITYRNAYLLGSGFVVRDLRYTGDQANMDDWCNVMLHGDNISNKALALLMPANLIETSDAGPGCVYCGLSGHESHQCPTRVGPPSDDTVWEKLGEFDLDVINGAFKKIESVLTAKGLSGFKELLDDEDAASVVMCAILDINALGQLRNVPDHWLYRMHEPDPDEEPPQRDDSPSWGFLERLVASGKDGLTALNNKVSESMLRYQRDSRLRMVAGFIQIERNDFEHAAPFFKESAALTVSASMQAWNDYFQARMAEEQGQLTQALELYSQIQRGMPHWRSVVYRAIVCRVKMGFCEPVLETLSKLIREDATYFYRALIDPAVERGRLMILSALHDLAEDAKTKAEKDRLRLSEMCDRINEWFPPEHDVQRDLGLRLRNLQTQAATDSYMISLKVMAERPGFENELEQKIASEVEKLRDRYKLVLSELQNIRDEASWVPIPGALKEFSRDFNECAHLINQAFASDFREAAAYHRSRKDLELLTKQLHKLRTHLKSLRMVRDGTIFGLTFFKTFLWVEGIGLLICFLTVPLVFYCGDSLHLGWLKNLLGSDLWSVQKVVIFIISLMSIGMAALRTTVIFERKKEKLLNDARRDRELKQQKRLENIRQQRRLEAKSGKTRDSTAQA